MPKETFYNLPQSKRERLVNAIKEELSREPFEKISINKIIKNANIPRGSFYQYFDDKYDMLSYILSEFRDKMFDILITNLDENDGDIFKTLSKSLEKTLDFSFKEENKTFSKNFFGDIKTNTLLCLKMTAESDNDNRVAQMKKHINLKIMNVSSDYDMKLMISSMFSLFRDAMIATFMNLDLKENALLKFNSTIELMKKGYLKKE